MSLDRLLFEVTGHYQSRGFSDSALSHLRWVLLSNVTKDRDKFCLKTAYPGCDKSVGDLLGKFRRCDVSTIENTETALAVFGFAFGYQMRNWPKDAEPTADHVVQQERQPGKNNTKLAEIAVEKYREHERPLFLQFEIAEAVGKNAKVAFSSSPTDQGTFAVAKEFVKAAIESEVNIKTVLLLAHKHHYERCRLILQQMGIQSVSAGEYDKYDRDEAQPRVMSQEEYIVNDFASMASMFTQ